MNEPAGPPYWDGGDRVWRVSRYRDVAFLLKSDQVVMVEVARELQILSDRIGGGPFPNLFLLLCSSHPFQNSAAHDEARSAVRDLVSGVQRHWDQKRIGGVVEALLEEIVCDEPFEACAALAKPLPTTVVADALEMSPRGVDRCGALTKSISEIWHSPARAMRELRAMEELAKEVVELLSRDCKQPDPRNFARISFLTMAGVDTTSALIGSAIHFLSVKPALQELLRERQDLIPAFVNETLRCRPPLKRIVGRRAIQNIEISENIIPRGALISMDLYAAHRDPVVYSEPNHFDLDRPALPLLAFGSGAHTCVGPALARLEAKTLVAGILSRFVIRAEPGALDGASRDWTDFQSLPVRFEALAKGKREH